MDGIIKVGLVGLGSINRKAYMPVLVREKGWTLTGCYARTKEKRDAFSEEYRVPAFESMEALAEAVDAVIINTSTDSHFEVANFFLEKGVHVLIDKPLANTVEECEKLIFSSVHYGASLMVAFNRRFSPMYNLLKDNITSTSLIRIVKKRSKGVGPDSFEFSIKDDYIHIVDTARWFFDGKLILVDGDLAVNSKNQLIYAEHFFRSPEGCRIQTLQHRDSGSDSEVIEVINEGRTYRVVNMSRLETEEGGKLTIKEPSPWDTVEHIKGFEGVIHHFFESLRMEREPESSGKEALATQRLIDSIVKSYY
ncbi:MAG TPA: Gfo/Idh/MocA family oxidoreductase [Clostridiaceae bacterium]|nr:Gfo/Idh/MocA family oxidoreductase [Clostridiaceae bacterium]